MRDEFVRSLAPLARNRRLVFLTGDLGFGALEPLQDLLGERFINAGIAEQNMVSMAAGLSGGGMETWVYSIGPFLYARALEQIRNDVAFHQLPVRLVGNGGGLAYGVMGPSHLSFDDYGILSNIFGLRIMVPAFDEDVSQIVNAASAHSGPIYLRLSRSSSSAPKAKSSFQQFRRLLRGGLGTLVTSGPMVGELQKVLLDRKHHERPSLWLVSEFPIERERIPIDLLEEASTGGPLIIAEEHIATGGLGQQLLSQFALSGLSLGAVRWVGITEEIISTYGSQEYLLTSLGLDATSILKLHSELVA